MPLEVLAWHVDWRIQQVKGKQSPSVIAPDKCQLSDLRDILNYIVRLFFRPDWLLRFELAVAQSGQCAYPVPCLHGFLGRPVTDNENLSGVKRVRFWILRKAASLVSTLLRSAK